MFPLWILFNWQICSFRCADCFKFSHIHFKSNDTYLHSKWSDLLENDRVIQCMLSILTINVPLFKKLRDIIFFGGTITL